MKAVLSRSPIILYYSANNLSKVVFKLWIQSNPNDLDVLDAPVYELESEAINDACKIEISDLIRSENQFEYEADFLTTRESATNILVQATLIDISNQVIEQQHNFMRIRDGYVLRNEQIQFFDNLIPSNVNDWDLEINANLFTEQPDQFNGNNGILIEPVDALNISEIRKLYTGNGIYTFSVYIEPLNVGEIRLSLGSVRSTVSFDLGSNTVSNAGSDVIGYDIIEFSTYKRLSISVDTDITTLAINFSSINGGVEANIFNATLYKGNWLHITPEELILQDNFRTFSSSNILPKIVFDRKISDTNYRYGLTNMRTTFENNIERQSVVFNALPSFLVYENLEGQSTNVSTPVEELCEPKFEPTKVSFVNRFGILQDLIFFKKRVDTFKVKSENFKSNPIQGNEFIPSVGQKKVFNKKAEASLKLSSGYYSESFNIVFKQLLYSELIYINDEPALITSSSWTEKTRVNDKLINYNLDFEFANNDINNIQ